MTNAVKFPATAVVVLALAAPVALAGGATASHTPARPKLGGTVQILVKGMKPNEKIKAHEEMPFGQSRNLYPRAGGGGALLVKTKSQVRGTHKWTFTGRRSHRVARTKYYVR